MSQQTNKIIHLSRELFESHAARVSLAPSRVRKVVQPLNFDAAARVKALVAVAKETGHTANVHKTNQTEDRLKPITRYQAVEVDALVFYAAQQEGLSIVRVSEEIVRFVGVPSLQNLSVMDYRRVRDYLWQRLKG